MSPLRKLDLSLRSFRQVQGVDYDETFSLVVMLRVCWNYISDYCIIYEILQMDVKTAFLNGFLKEELYMMQPKGFVDPKDAKRYASSSDPSMD